MAVVEAFLLVLGLLSLVVGGAVLGLVAGGVAILARTTLGYRRTAGFLEYVVAAVPGPGLDTSRLSRLVFAELLFYAVLGIGFLLSFLGLSFSGQLPPFYGALSYSGSALTALTVVCVAYVAGVGSLILFTTEAESRSEFFGVESVLGMTVGMATFAVATRATVLMTMYPRNHDGLLGRARTDLPFGWILDVLPFPILAGAFAFFAAVALVVRPLDSWLRVWHVLLLVSVVTMFAPLLAFRYSIGPLDPVIFYELLTLWWIQALGVVALVLAGVEYNVDAAANPVDET